MGLWYSPTDLFWSIGQSFFRQTHCKFQWRPEHHNPWTHLSVLTKALIQFPFPIGNQFSPLIVVSFNISLQTIWSNKRTCLSMDTYYQRLSVYIHLLIIWRNGSFCSKSEVKLLAAFFKSEWSRKTTITSNVQRWVKLPHKVDVLP